MYIRGGGAGAVKIVLAMSTLKNYFHFIDDLKLEMTYALYDNLEVLNHFSFNHHFFGMFSIYINFKFCMFSIHVDVDIDVELNMFFTVHHLWYLESHA